MMRLMRSRMLRVDDGICAKYLPTALTKIWACNFLAERTLKLENWCSHFFWMVKKKGYEWSIIDVSGEEEVEEELDSVVILEDSFVTSGVDIGERERDLLASVHITYFNDDAERNVLKMKIAGTATKEQLAMLKKYSVQKHFEEKTECGRYHDCLEEKGGYNNATAELGSFKSPRFSSRAATRAPRWPVPLPTSST